MTGYSGYNTAYIISGSDWSSSSPFQHQTILKNIFNVNDSKPYEAVIIQPIKGLNLPKNVSPQNSESKPIERSHSSSSQNTKPKWIQKMGHKFNKEELKSPKKSEESHLNLLGPIMPKEIESPLFLTNSILTSKVPIDLAHENETITVNGETGILANREDIINWSGPVPISEYPINEDPSPEIIRKFTEHNVEYNQEVAIRYLRPPTPPPPGDIIIRQEKSYVPPPAPPLVIRQQPPRPETPAPLVIREAPPKPSERVEPKIITISGKRIPPPPRKVIIERLPPLPAKPQSVIIERWLPFREQKRRVVYQKTAEPDAYYEKPRNLIIQWEAPNLTINREYRDLGVVRANPDEYRSKYSDSLRDSSQLPDFAREIRPPEGISLASDLGFYSKFDLEGDLDALSLIDLDKEGLSEYKSVENQRSLSSVSSQSDPSTLNYFNEAV